MPNIKEIELKRSVLSRVADLLLQDVKFSYVSRGKDGLLSIDSGLIDLEDELYKLLFSRILDLSRASDIYKKIGIHYVSFK